MTSYPEYINGFIKEFRNKNATLRKTGEKIIIDGFSQDDDDDWPWAIYRKNENDLFSKEIHLSRIFEFWALYTAEEAWNEHEQKLKQDEPPKPCLKHKHECFRCGCKEPLISGDNVYFGYTGWPICPNCKEC